MSTARARRFAPIFSATIIPASVEPLITVKGDAYTRLTGAKVIRDGVPEQIRTVLAFGKSHANVHHLLAPGVPVELAVQYSGGSLKIIGLPRENAAPAAMQGAKAQNLGTTVSQMAIMEISSILWMCGIEKNEQDPIIDEMLTGESSRPSDEPCFEDELSPEHALVIQHYGHIINPLLNAGINLASAARVTDLLLDTPAGLYLNDMFNSRYQAASQSN